MSQQSPLRERNVAHNCLRMFYSSIRHSFTEILSLVEVWSTAGTTKQHLQQFCNNWWKFAAYANCLTETKTMQQGKNLPIVTSIRCKKPNSKQMLDPFKDEHGRMGIKIQLTPQHKGSFLHF